MAGAAARGQVGLELVSVDSTIVRAHHESAGQAVAGEILDALERALTEEKRALTEEKGGSTSPTAAGAAGDPATPHAEASAPETADAERAAVRRRRRVRADAARLGRSRGGLSSRIHAAVDAAGLPLSCVLTHGQAGHCPQFQTVLDKIRVPGPSGRPRTRPDAVAADRAYSSKDNRASLRRRHITAVIPEKVGRQANRRKKGGRRTTGHLRQGTPQTAQHRRTLLPEAQDLARPGYPLRQGTRQLYGRTPPP
ncbi:transposase [Streptomyces sp. 8L]|nr:transposase [Streptomyces sp. 8L]MCA1220692.1 transposase [Streptomyces sp. 8L]